MVGEKGPFEGTWWTTIGGERTLVRGMRPDEVSAARGARTEREAVALVNALAELRAEEEEGTA